MLFTSVGPSLKDIYLLRQLADNKGKLRLIISLFRKDCKGKMLQKIIMSKPYVNNSYHKHIIVKHVQNPYE